MHKGDGKQSPNYFLKGGWDRHGAASATAESVQQQGFNASGMADILSGEAVEAVLIQSQYNECGGVQ